MYCHWFCIWCVCQRIMSSGFQNRMYIDDFCYMNIFHRYGLLGAIFNSYNELNGRFTGHVLNFLAFSFGKASIPFSTLIAFLAVGGSLFYLFKRLFVVTNQTGFSNSRSSHLTSMPFSLIIIVPTSLMAPFLYESIYWTLHSLIVTGSPFFVYIFIGLVLYFTTDSPKRFGQSGIALVYALVGFCAMGFSEPVALFLLSLFSLLVLILLILKNNKKYSGLLLVLHLVPYVDF